MGNPSRAAPAVLAIFALTYLGIALGRVPGLKLNRTGIALLGAIAIMIFSGLPTTSVIGFINWPTILLLFGFLCPVGATALVRFLRQGRQRHFGSTRTTRAVSADPDAGDGRAVGVSESRHRLFRLHAGRGDRAAPPATQSRSVSHRVGDCQQHRCGRHARRQSARHDDRPDCRAGFRALHALVHSRRYCSLSAAPTRSSG